MSISKKTILLKKNHLYFYAASIAFFGFSPAAWGMDYLSSWGDTENSVKSKLVSSLAPQILPPIQNGETIMTRSREPACEKPLIHQIITLDGSFVREKNSFIKMLLGGGDGIRVDQPDNWPNSAHGIVHATFQSGNKSYEYLGSGTLIAPNLVLTAANNLYHTDIVEDKPIGKAKKVKFYPALNGEITPFPEQNVRDFYFTEEYTKDKKENYGLLVLENPVGEMTGYLGISVLPPKKILELEINITGYPGTSVQDESSQCEMWQMKSKATEVTQDLIHYQLNSDWDKNGSGVWHKDYNNYFVIGVHSSREESLGINTAVLLTKPRYEKIRAWVKDSFDKLPASTLKEGMFSSVESADLERKYIGNFGLNILFNYAKYLRTVNLSYNSIGDDGCSPLLSLPTLTELNLSSNKVGDDGFKLLVQHPSLTDLKLSNNYITFNNVSENFFKNSALLSLDLAWNLVDHDRAMILSQSSNLTKLNLSNNKINDAGEVLFSLAKNTRLKTLSFSNPYEVSRSRKALACARTGVAIGILGRTVGIKMNDEIDDAKELTIMRSEGKFAIGIEEAKVISQSKSLMELDLSDTYAGIDTVSILLTSPSITSLNLSWNALNDTAFTHSVIRDLLETNETLTYLNLENNNIKNIKVQNFINTVLNRNIILNKLKMRREQLEFMRVEMEVKCRDNKALGKILLMQSPNDKTRLEFCKFAEKQEFEVNIVFADLGHADAQFNLGLKYGKGQGVPKDDVEAVKWYQKAADQGHAEAQYNLGVMYANGQGELPKDKKKAVEWCTKAADQGHKEVQFKLGRMYLKYKKMAEAVAWFRKAADQGHEGAQKTLEQIQSKGESEKNQEI